MKKENNSNNKNISDTAFKDVMQEYDLKEYILAEKDTFLKNLGEQRPYRTLKGHKRTADSLQ